MLFCRSEGFLEEIADNGSFLIVLEPCQYPPYNFEDIFNEGHIWPDSAPVCRCLESPFCVNYFSKQEYYITNNKVIETGMKIESKKSGSLNVNILSGLVKPYVIFSSGEY